MKLSDIVALAKAGYKMKDIEALQNAEKENDIIEDVSSEVENSDTEVEKVETYEEKADDNIELEELRKLLAEKEKALKSAQEQNLKQNIKAETPDTADTLADLVRSFM